MTPTLPPMERGLRPSSEIVLLIANTFANPVHPARIQCTPPAVDPLPPARGRVRERGAFRGCGEARHVDLFPLTPTLSRQGRGGFFDGAGITGVRSLCRASNPRLKREYAWGGCLRFYGIPAIARKNEAIRRRVFFRRPSRRESLGLPGPGRCTPELCRASPARKPQTLRKFVSLKCRPS